MAEANAPLHPALSNVAMRDVATLIHPYTNLATHRETGPRIFDHAKGVYIYGADGREYIEAMSGLWCTSLGYGEEALVEAAAEQMRKLSFAHLFNGSSHEPAIALAEKLKEIAPIPVSRLFFVGSGSEANDTQVKLAWYYNNAIGRPEKKKIIARKSGYHGVTVAAASLTGLENNHRDFDLPIARILHTDTPHHFRYAEPGESEEDYASRLAESLDRLIETEGPETVAAFIAEPVMGAGGVVLPPRTYFGKICAVCEKHDVLVISDEVICGFGRTGNLFGCETFSMRPQTISFAKAVTSAYLPLGGVMVPGFIDEALVAESRKIGTFGHGNTYSGHPVCAAVALRTLELMEERDILGHVRAVAPHFAARLEAFSDHPLVGEARGAGLIGGLELVLDKAAKRFFEPGHGLVQKVTEKGFAHGLISRVVGGNVLAFSPPLVITTDEIDEMFDRAGRVLDDVEAWVEAEGFRTA